MFDQFVIQFFPPQPTDSLSFSLFFYEIMKKSQNYDDMFYFVPFARQVNLTLRHVSFCTCPFSPMLPLRAHICGYVGC